MSEKYVAKKYVTTASVAGRTIMCPNCHQPMTLTGGRAVYCLSSPNCKLYDITYREVKSLTTIERVNNAK